MIKKIRNLIRNKKREKLMKEQDNVPIVIPSLSTFIDKFKSNIRKHVAMHNSSEPANLSIVIDGFHSIAIEALVDTLIDVGYKRKKGK
jgi:hypothetical protein